MRYGFGVQVTFKGKDITLSTKTLKESQTSEGVFPVFVNNPCLSVI